MTPTRTEAPTSALAPQPPRWLPVCRHAADGRPSEDEDEDERLPSSARHPDPPAAAATPFRRPALGRLRDGETASCRVTPGRSLGRPRRSSSPSLRPEIRPPGRTQSPHPLHGGSLPCQEVKARSCSTLPPGAPLSATHRTRRQ